VTPSRSCSIDLPRLPTTSALSPQCCEAIRELILLTERQPRKAGAMFRLIHDELVGVDADEAPSPLTTIKRTTTEPPWGWRGWKRHS
jgi:hypothetical protein